MSMFGQGGSDRSLLHDVGWGLRQIGLWVVFFAVLILLPSDGRGGHFDADVEVAGILVAAGLLVGAVLGILRPQAERGGYRGAAIAGGAAGAAVTIVGISAKIVFGTQESGLWGWFAIVVFGSAGGALLGLEARYVKREEMRAERGEPPLLYTVFRSHLPRWLWVTGREFLLLTTCMVPVPALLCLIVAIGGSAEVNYGCFLDMVPLGGALYIMILIARAVGK